MDSEILLEPLFLRNRLNGFAVLAVFPPKTKNLEPNFPECDFLSLTEKESCCLQATTENNRTTEMFAPKRHTLKAIRSEMSRPAIRRLARRGGVSRISSGVYKSANETLR